MRVLRRLQWKRGICEHRARTGDRHRHPERTIYHLESPCANEFAVLTESRDPRAQCIDGNYGIPPSERYMRQQSKFAGPLAAASHLTDGCPALIKESKLS